ncbi:unnamed protein product [Phytophthora fragariaefolia]|uniref:Unnamed protein product n=1 Tax=Phytophthora fragariaefolia TaxID=1490495 RepID=A0A9W6XNU4_9STRA|nr:unnamed protein product [Phytophthora fragariaefolia]
MSSTAENVSVFEDGTKKMVQVPIRSTLVPGGTKKMVQVPIRSTLVPGGTKKMVQVPIRSTLVPGGTSVDLIDQRSRSRSIWCNHFVNPE